MGGGRRGRRGGGGLGLGEWFVRDLGAVEDFGVLRAVEGSVAGEGSRVRGASAEEIGARWILAP